jgi:monoamine oxidase
LQKRKYRQRKNGSHHWGGTSGLAAAQNLQDKGFSVTVLEAQEKVGERLRSNRSLGI